MDTFPTVVGVRDAGRTADDTSTFMAAVVALVTNVHERMQIDKGIAYHAESIACFQVVGRGVEEGVATGEQFIATTIMYVIDRDMIL